MLVPMRPRATSLRALAAAAADCRACDLWRHATRTVFGAGRARARLLLVGEQPGNEEDRVVKHFKWEPRGRWRIHKKPSAAEIAACRPWLDAELSALRPKAVVCLGATAAKALLGPRVRVTEQRGTPIASSLAPLVFVTVHPAAVLRAPDDVRARETRRLIADLRAVARALEAT